MQKTACERKKKIKQNITIRWTNRPTDKSGYRVRSKNRLITPKSKILPLDGRTDGRTDLWSNRFACTRLQIFMDTHVLLSRDGRPNDKLTCGINWARRDWSSLKSDEAEGCFCRSASRRLSFVIAWREYKQPGWLFLSSVNEPGRSAADCCDTPTRIGLAVLECSADERRPSLSRNRTSFLPTSRVQRRNKQAQAGNSMRHLRDIRRGVTDGRTDEPSYRDAMTHLKTKKKRNHSRLRKNCGIID